jgi:hypothetical protein
VGVRASTLFRNTGAPYTDPLNTLTANPSLRAGSVDASVTLGLPIHASFPLLQRGFEPQNADLKVGPFFFKLHSLTGAILYSDNVNLTETNRESGTIGIVSLTASVIAQITEGVRIAVSGSFVYLPFQGEAGIAGFGVFAPYLLGLDEEPILRSEVVWDTNIRGWNVVFADDFHIGLGRFSDNIRDQAILFEGGGFDKYDRAGRYIFRAPVDQNAGFRRTNRDRNENFVYYSNIVSAQIDRLLPTQTRLRVQALHENLWYNQGNRGRPTLRDQITVSLVSERENLRFKPFFVYQALKTDLYDQFDHIIRFGIDGPITDQLKLHAEAGYYFGQQNQDSVLWAINLVHLAGPYTQESVFFRRTVSTFHQEIDEAFGYNIHQVLGPKLFADAFISHDRITGIDSNALSRTEWLTGIRLNFLPGPRSNFILTGTYENVDADFEKYEIWTGRLEWDQNLTDTLVARLIYQYQQNNSNLPRGSYEENLVYFGMTKYFR